MIIIEWIPNRSTREKRYDHIEILKIGHLNLLYLGSAVNYALGIYFIKTNLKK